MTVAEWMAKYEAQIKIEDVDEEFLNSEMTEEMENDIWNQISKGIKYNNVSASNSTVTPEALDELINKVMVASYPKEEYIMFAYTEEAKEQMKRYYPNAKIKVLPKEIKLDSDDDNTVYVIPCDGSVNNLRVVFEDEI